MRNVIKKINETGTLLVEALAMLGLISMVTPVLYKKASERTVELQDINASSQLRALSTAMDSYLKDKFADISRGETINGINYSDFKDSESASIDIPSGQIADVLKDYLPYGFLDNAGNLRETKLFNDYSITIKSESELKDGKAISQVLTSFIVIGPKNPDDFSTKRAARVASMVGSNGGYVTDNVAMGAQGIWSVPGAELGGNLADNTLVISSLQPISSQGLANEDVLHRHDEPDASDELNSMTTDLFMTYGNEEGNPVGHNIRLVNQIIMTPNEAGMVDKETGKPANRDDATRHNDHLGEKYTTSVDNALYIGNKGGAYLEGVLKAMDDHFTVTADGIKYFNDKTFTTVGEDPKYSDATFAVSGNEMIYGNPQGGANALKLVVNSGLNGAPSLEYGVPSYDAPGIGGAPVTYVGYKVLYADPNQVGLGSSHAGLYSFSVIKDPTDAARPWNVVMGDNLDVWNGTVTQYVWNETPNNGNDVANHNYELSVNGSAYVRDTILTAKLKTFDVDAATLRAGVPHEDFNTAEDDNFFFKVRSELDGADQAGALMVGASDAPMITVTNSDNNPYNLPSGVVVHTEDVTGNGGINIISGTNTTPRINTNYEVSGVADAYETQEGMVKIGGSDGVYLTTMVGDDFTIAPVSIQGEMFRAYADWGNTDRTIEEIVDTSILSSHGYRYGALDNMGEREINDMRVTVNDVNDKTVMEITPSLNSEDSSGADDNAVVRMIGRTAIYDWDYNKDNASDGPSFVAEKGKIMVKATATADTAQGIQPGDDILVVDNNGSVADADRGSVYIRKGSINIDSQRAGARLTDEVIRQQYEDTGTFETKGYIAADRFIAHYDNSDGLATMLANSRGTGKYGLDDTRPYKAYDGYEVNPAYTSVMHDIKLTTRGGARLSDILPDFINKGIYVVDTSVKVSATPNWTDEEADTIPSGVAIEAKSGDEVSEYMGFVPTPKCPPGYAKVITLTPATWAMAQAGTPVVDNGRTDILPRTDWNDYLTATDDVDLSQYVLRFQKNTWLKSLVRPYCSNRFHAGTGTDNCAGDDTFKGWGTIMGFIYPEVLYNQDTGGHGEIGDNVIWNLLPVRYKELEGYATVYCYFDRTDPGFNEKFVDKDYDQMKALDEASLNSREKGDRGQGSEYLRRLDDPELKYKSPW